MYHVALVNLTDRVIEYAETYDTREAAAERVQKGLEPQAAINAIGAGTCEAGKDWQAYGPAETPFEWPVKE